MGQMRIFVSHSHADNEFCHALVGALRDAGADVWFDEQNLGAGHILDVIQKELASRPVFIVILSPAAFGSRWVKQECQWAFNLHGREPNRIILPVVAQPINPANFNDWLFLESFRRIEAPGYQPYPVRDAIEQTLGLIGLTAKDPDGFPPEGETVYTSPRSNAKLLMKRGWKLLDEKQYAQAMPIFEQATRLAPKGYRTWLGLASAHKGLQQWQEAVQAYEMSILLQQKPNDWEDTSEDDLTLIDLWKCKADALFAWRRYPEALEAYEKARDLDKEFKQRWNVNATVLGAEIRVSVINTLRALGREREAQDMERENAR